MPTPTTANRGYQQPDPTNNLDVDVYRLVAALDAIDLDVANLIAADTALAPVADPAFTGAPTAPTAAQGNNSSQIATTAYVRTAVATLLDSAPGTLDTLNELAAALGDDPNYATTVANLVATKAALVHTHAVADVTGLQAALDALTAADALKLNLTGGTLTGILTITNQLRVERDLAQQVFYDADGTLRGQIYNQAEYWGLVPSDDAGTAIWASRLAYDMTNDRWHIGDENNLATQLLNWTGIRDEFGFFDISIPIPDGSAVNNHTLTLIKDSPHKVELINLQHIQSSGNGTFTVRKNAVDITGLVAVNPGAAWATATPSATTTLDVGDDLEIFFDNNFASDANSHVQIKMKRVK